MTDAEFDGLVARLTPVILERIAAEKPWLQNAFVPDMDVYRVGGDTPFMRYNTCSARDFFHPEFKRLAALIRNPEDWHRKLWEWIFVLHHAFATSSVREGARGLVFGVGLEALPAVFAGHGVFVTATDAPVELGIDGGWFDSNEYGRSRDAMSSLDVPRDVFNRLVEWRPCDMNAIDPGLVDYDFCWSSCCFEHLGSLRRGMDFVINSVERTLKVGGVAIHTTEFNLSSNTDTLAEGDTVIYRLRDIEQLIDELRARGHHVQPFAVAPDSLVLDGFVDTPPFSGPALKLRLEGFTCTSAGLVIRRGA